MERMKKSLLDKSTDFSGTELIAIMDSFKEPLHSHLKAEPGAFVALPMYITPGKPVDILGIADAASKIEFYCSVSSCFGLFGPMVLR